MTPVSTLLASFKSKIEDAVTLVPGMPAEEKLKAVQFWNVVSEKLQEIVNNSAADISALALELEKENAAKMLGAALTKPEVHGSAPQLEAHIPNENVSANMNQPMSAGQLPDVAPSTMHCSDVEIHGAVATHQQSPGDSIILGPAEASIPANSELTLISSLPESSNDILSLGTTDADLSPASDHPQLISNCSTANEESSGNAFSTAANIASDPTLQQQGQATTVTTLTTLRTPEESLIKMNASKRGRGRPPGSVKREKVEDVDWSPMEERPNNRGQKANNTTKDSIRRHSSRQSRRNFLLDEIKTVDAVVDDDDGEESDGLDAGVDGLNDDDINTDDEPDDEEEDDEMLDEETNSDGENQGKSSNVDRNIDDGSIIPKQECKTENQITKLDGKSKRNRRRREVIDETPDGGNHICDFCTRKFPNIAVFTAHRWNHTKPYACTECSARFSTKGNLIVHKRRHTGEKPYGCNQCDARFSTKGNLKRHVKTHSGEKPWECVQCGGRFTEKKSLKVHMRRHTGEKPYQCKVCGKRFAQTGILQTHMAMHMDQKAHLCDHCGKSFRQKSQLRLHMMRHEGVRKYQCMSCPARFLTKGDLERHNRIHTGERPFVCELCGKTFTRQQSLNEHMNRHYGLKPYECKYCGKNFAEMSACYKHIKQHERTQLTPVEHQVTLDASGQITIPSDGQKFTVLVHTDQALDVGSEISVVQQEQSTVIPADSITVVSDQISDFTAINLLATSATNFQQNF